MFQNSENLRLPPTNISAFSLEVSYYLDSWKCITVLANFKMIFAILILFLEMSQHGAFLYKRSDDKVAAKFRAGNERWWIISVNILAHLHILFSRFVRECSCESSAFRSFHVTTCCRLHVRLLSTVATSTSHSRVTSHTLTTISFKHPPLFKYVNVCLMTSCAGLAVRMSMTWQRWRTSRFKNPRMTRKTSATCGWDVDSWRMRKSE